MGEIGLVIDTDNDMVTVRLERIEACAKCRACTAGMSKNEMLIKAANLCNAKINNYVNIELESKDFLMAIVIMYGAPFVVFVAGIALGILVTGNEIYSFFAGCIFMLLTYFVINKNENYFKSKNYLPSATEVVTNEQPPL